MSRMFQTVAGDMFVYECDDVNVMDRWNCEQDSWHSACTAPPEAAPAPIAAETNTMVANYLESTTIDQCQQRSSQGLLIGLSALSHPLLPLPLMLSGPTEKSGVISLILLSNVFLCSFLTNNRRNFTLCTWYKFIYIYKNIFEVLLMLNITQWY